MKEKCKNCGRDWHVGITCKEQAKIEFLPVRSESAEFKCHRCEAMHKSEADAIHCMCKYEKTPW